MSLAQRFADLKSRADGWLNPVMVKELRQAVRGRFIVTVLSLSLLAQVVAVAGFMISGAIDNRNAALDPIGSVTFTTLFFVLFTATVFFVPLYSGIRMAIERSDTNVDLLFVTTIRPRTVILGKLMTTIALTALIFFASLPFLVFSYVLRGIDVLTIVFVLFIAFFAVCSAAVVALFLGCIPATKPFRFVLGLVFFGVSAMAYAGMAAMITSFIRSSTAMMFVTSDFWTAVISAIMVVAAIDAVLLVTTTVIITPPAANRALPIRLMMAIVWLVSFAIAARLTFRFRDASPILMWAMVQLLFITLVMCSAVGERERWGPRVARTIPENPLKRFVAFLFFSGAGGGTLWALLFYSLTIGAYELVLKTRPPSLISTERVISAQVLAEAAMCFVAYLLTAQLVRRKYLSQRVPARATWAIGLVVFLIVAVIPPLVLLSAYSGTPQLRAQYEAVTMLNPFPNFDGQTHFARLPVLMIWTL
ncbi:MAG TPA: hypothetical protein VF608_12830, partial [Thermoanaerobaculia bacterium]